MNKKKVMSKISLPFVLFLLSGTLFGCSSAQDGISLHILNMEDYIYLHNPKNGYDEPNIYDEQFKQYLIDNEDTYPQFKGKKINIIYDTTDTNETLYSKLQTGKANYDVICPSDYMIQKLLSQDMLVKLNKEAIPNYYGEDSKASPYFTTINTLITSKSYKTKEDYSLYDYSVGYMWGTLGIIYNPNFHGFSQDAKANVNEDMKHYSSLWNQRYKQTFSIKNSIRDTYVVGVMETFKPELETLKQQYQDGKITSIEYFSKLSEIINRSDDENSKLVFDTLYALKENAFGLEIDSGKQDIVTGKIGINIAWSGDSVYSINQASDPKQVTSPFQLYYSIPDLGANVWFDSWVIPKLDSRSPETLDLAHAFLNFMSDPEYACKNMDYTGYTSCIAGEEIRNYTLDLYDVRKKLVTYYKDDEHNYDLFYVDPLTKELTVTDYNDFSKEISDVYQNVELRYYEGEYEEKDGHYVDKKTGEELTFEKLKSFEGKNHYKERFLVDENNEPYKSAKKVNLNYFFGETLSSEEDSVFYTDQYCLEGAEDIIGGAFFAQFPSEKAITRCSVMKDFRENNTKIMQRWEEFKSSAFPIWAIVLISIEVGVILLGVTTIIVNKKIKKTLRKKRKEEEAN